MKQALKQVIARILLISGLLNLLLAIRLRNRVVVLTYHRVLKDEMFSLSHSSPGIVVSEKSFERNLRTLKKYFNVITLKQLESIVNSRRPLRGRHCVVTFDDGWLDNYEVALPLLKKYRIPATLFAPTDFIGGTSPFWQEELTMNFGAIAKSQRANDVEFIRELLGAAGVPNSDEIRRFVSTLKSRPYQEIERIVDDFRAHTHDDDTRGHYDRFVDWAQLEEMAQQGISIGSHACSHRILTRLSRSECTAELKSSKEILEEKLGEEITVLAYPNGDYNEQVKGLAGDCGYVLAFTTEKGLLSKNSAPLALPRINIHEGRAYDEAVFLASVVGLF